VCVYRVEKQTNRQTKDAAENTTLPCCAMPVQNEAHKDTHTAVTAVHNAPNEHVVGDVVQVTAVLEPRPSRTDVIGRTLALHLQTHTHTTHTNSHLLCTDCGSLLVM